MTPETFIDFTAPNGMRSWYHVWRTGTAGFLYYFDGDYWDLDDTSINWPEEGDLARLAVAAQARNLMLVAVNTPDTDGRGDGYTWWAVSYTHLTLPTIHGSCRSRWSPYH